MLPIVIIEVALLVLYFGITGYLEKSATDILDLEASRSLGEIATREARNIDIQLESVARLSGLLQQEDTRLFGQSAAVPPPVFRRAPNGVLYKAVDNGGASLWYSSLTAVGPAELAKAASTEAFDPLFRAVLQTDKKIVAVYFNSRDSMCRYYPWLPEVYNVFDPKMDIPTFNFYYLADAAHNPTRAPVWTPAYLDPAGQGWMASCVAPIYHGPVLEGVTGIDITIDSIIKNLLTLDLPWGGSAMLVDDQGVIIALPEVLEATLGLKELRNEVYHSTVKADTVKPEEFNLFKNKNKAVAQQFEAVFRAGTAVSELSLDRQAFLMTNTKIAATGWHVLVLVDKATVRAPIVELDRLTKQFGLVALVAMLAFYTAFFSLLVLRSRRVAESIAVPLGYLADKSDDIRRRPTEFQFEPDRSGITELGRLSENFGAMATDLSSLYNDLEGKVRRRTEELEAANRELERATLQMAQQDKMASIGQLAAGVAHEINNPMSFVVSNLGTLQDAWERLATYLEAERGGATDLAALRERLEIDYLLSDGPALFRETLVGTSRVQAIVNELRTFSRSSDAVEQADLNALVESVLKITSSELKHRIEVKLALGDVPPVRCNPGQISQVLLNLVVNAVQAIRGPGRLELRSGLLGGEVFVAVQDSGVGIPPEVQGRIFEPFFTTKPVGQGTGLGLSVSYAIVQQHAGRLEVVSAPGQGSTFTMWLPVGS